MTLVLAEVMNETTRLQCSACTSNRRISLGIEKAYTRKRTDYMQRDMSKIGSDETRDGTISAKCGRKEFENAKEDIRRKDRIGKT